MNGNVHLHCSDSGSLSGAAEMSTRICAGQFVIWEEDTHFQRQISGGSSGLASNDAGFWDALCQASFILDSVSDSNARLSA
uniref:Uncharacterized protein n=1 Tax=Megaselia scalaris TaxID=36166 RepID=T1GLM0_MEGSC